MTQSSEQNKTYTLKLLGKDQIGLIVQDQKDTLSPLALALTMNLVRNGTPQSFIYFMRMLHSLTSLNGVEDEEIITISIPVSELRAFASEPGSTDLHKE